MDINDINGYTFERRYSEKKSYKRSIRQEEDLDKLIFEYILP